MSGEGEEGDVVLETTAGPFTVELYWRHTPKTCRNFYELARRGYYDGTPFHRVVADFVIQGGDPTGTGTGGESIWGGKFEDEVTRELKHTGAGILSMANSGRNSNGSQFFVTLAPCPWLDGKHTIFGRVSAGMRVVRDIAAVRVDDTYRPIDTVAVLRARTLPHARAREIPQSVTSS